MSNFTSVGTTTMTPGVAPYDDYGIFADVLKIAGKHNIKLGVDTCKFQKGQLVLGNSAGAYTFDNTFTKANGSVTANPIGLDLAALELGLPTTASGRQVAREGDTVAWTASGAGAKRYLALFNLGDKDKTVTRNYVFYNLPAKTYHSRELWSANDRGTPG